jgi:hypothetical protein
MQCLCGANHMRSITKLHKGDAPAESRSFVPQKSNPAAKHLHTEEDITRSAYFIIFPNFSKSFVLLVDGINYKQINLVNIVVCELEIQVRDIQCRAHQCRPNTRACKGQFSTTCLKNGERINRLRELTPRLNDFDRISAKIEEVQAAINERTRLSRNGSDITKVPAHRTRHDFLTVQGYVSSTSPISRDQLGDNCP